MSETAAGTAEQVTVALVHGAFADSSSWNGVVEQLLKAGIPVQSVSNPLRGIGPDSAYVAKALAPDSWPGLGGRSLRRRRRHLERRYRPRQRRRTGLRRRLRTRRQRGSRRHRSRLHRQRPHLRSRHPRYPVGDDARHRRWLYIDPAQFHQAFAADLSLEQAGHPGRYPTARSQLRPSPTRTGPPHGRPSLPWVVVPDRRPGGGR